MNKLLRILLLCTLLPAMPLAAEQTLTALAPRPAPSFALPDLGDATLTLASLRGKTVIVNFWATWCPPCRKEMPGLQRAWEQLRDDGVVVLGVAVAEDQALVTDYARQLGLDFPLVLDAESAVAVSWGVRGLPTTFVVNAAGELVFEALGEREWDDPALLERIRRLTP
ncbi:MAG: hypothetical protein RLZ44_999 [Pseudomonadota bacterium]|jgi:peroxiredoxin